MVVSSEGDNTFDIPVNRWVCGHVVNSFILRTCFGAILGLHVFGFYTVLSVLLVVFLVDARVWFTAY